MRHIHDAISETLGFRALQQEIGRDVHQLKLMLHEPGYYRPDADDVSTGDEGWNIYTQDAVDTVDRSRGYLRGIVDAIERLWSELEREGRALEVRWIQR